MAIGLQFNNHARSALAQREHFGERGHALTGELRTRVAADVHRSELGGVGLPDFHRGTAHLHQIAIMDHYHLAVLRFLDVQFDEVAALLGSQAEGRECILRGRGRRAAMADHQHRLIGPGRKKGEEREANGAEDRQGCQPRPRETWERSGGVGAPACFRRRRNPRLAGLADAQVKPDDEQREQRSVDDRRHQAKTGPEQYQPCNEQEQ